MVESAHQLAAADGILDLAKRNRHRLEGVAFRPKQRVRGDETTLEPQPAMRRGTQEVDCRPGNKAEPSRFARHEEGGESLAPGLIGFRLMVQAMAERLETLRQSLGFSWCPASAALMRDIAKSLDIARGPRLARQSRLGLSLLEPEHRST
jgi:hypothetical protein